jgi:hypothetical protein
MIYDIIERFGIAYGDVLSESSSSVMQDQIIVAYELDYLE